MNCFQAHPADQHLKCVLGPLRTVSPSPNFERLAPIAARAAATPEAVPARGRRALDSRQCQPTKRARVV